MAGTEGAVAPAGTQAIQRVLKILWSLAEHGELGITEVADRAGLTAGTAARMVRALAAEGMVRRNPATDAYHLAARTVLLGQAAQRALGLDKAMPAMEQLASTTRESINLAVREGPESVVLARVQSTLPLRYEQQVGARFPLYSTASGKAILAHSTDTDHYLAGLPSRLEPVAPGTVPTVDALAEQLAEIRRRGFAIDVEENVEGVHCVGAPILDEHRIARAAVVIQAPAVRLGPDRVDDLGALVVASAAELSHLLPAAPGLL